MLLFSLFYQFLFFIECNCDQDGSKIGKCDNVGKCACNRGFDGVKCDTCAKGFAGEKCKRCNDGFYGYPNCQGRFLFLIFPCLNTIIPQMVSSETNF